VALSEGAIPARKRLLHALVHEVRVQGPDAIYPVFRVPGGEPPAPGRGVRTMYGSVPSAGIPAFALCRLPQPLLMRLATT
jgi:hypothetical protein